MVKCLHGPTLKQAYHQDLSLAHCYFDLYKQIFRRSHNKCQSLCRLSVVDDKILSATNLNNDLNKTNAWTNQWKMIFNPDPNKQAQEIIFPCKIKKDITTSTKL